MDSTVKETFLARLDKIIINLILVAFLIIAIIFAAYSFSKSSSSGISLNEFNNIQNGMTYDDVVNIIGEEGTVLSVVDLGIGSQYASAMYVWYGSNGIANANVTFQGGKVTMKAQYGLR